MRFRFAFSALVCLLLAVAYPAIPQGIRPHFDTFRAVIGADDDGAGTPSSVTFQVWLDGESVFESKVMRPGDAAQSIDIPLGSAKEIMLVVTNGGDTIANDRADWADARLVDSTTGAVAFLSDLPWRKEGEWVPTIRDRNALKNPIRLNGKVYPKGLGGFALMRLVWKDWDNTVAQRLDTDWRIESELRKTHGEPKLSIGHPPTGVESITVDGQIVWVEGDSADVRVDLTDKEEVLVTVVQADSDPPSSARSIGGIQIELPDATVPLSTLTPDAADLLAGAADEGPRGVFNGVERSLAFGPGAKVRLTWRNPVMKVTERRRLDARSDKDDLLFLEGAVGLDMEKATGAGSVVFKLYVDGEPVFDSGLITGDKVARTGRLGIGEGDDLLLVVEDAGNGGYEDCADWADLKIIDGKGKPRGYLTDYDMDMATQRWGTPTEDAGILCTTICIGGENHARGIGTSAPSQIRYRGITTTIKRRSRASVLLQESRAAWENGDLSKAIALARQSLTIDDGEPRAYTDLATMLEERGDKKEALRQWRRIVEVARYDRKEVNRSRTAIERLYAQLLPETPSERIPKNEPLLMIVDGKPISLTELAGGIRSIEVGRQTVGLETTIYRGEGRFKVGPTEAGRSVRFLVNSRGLSIKATLCELTEDGRRRPAVTSTAAVNPNLTWIAREGEWVIEIAHDVRRDGFESIHNLWCMADLGYGEEPPSTTESWTYRGMRDGSAKCEVVIDGPDVIALPLSATGLKVEGGKVYVGPPAYEYGSRLEWPYSASRLVSIVPTSASATIRFTFPDGAMNVPITRWGGPRDRNYYWRSLSPVNPGLAKCTVAFYPTAGTTKIVRATPDGYERDGDAFVWEITYGKDVTVEAENRQVTSQYITRKHRRLTSYVPKAPYYEAWADEHIDLVGRIYDALAAVVDWEPDEEVFVSVPDPAQLPGYSGATWSEVVDGRRICESWIPVRGQVSEYALRYQYGAGGIKTHELHWVFMRDLTDDVPDWLREMMSSYMELAGRIGGNGPFFDIWPRREWRYEKRAQEYRSQFTRPGDGYAWMNDERLKERSEEERVTRSAVLCRLAKEIESRYGPGFWGEFWSYERADPGRFADLDERGRTIAAIEDIGRVAGATDAVKELFESWTFDLTPESVKVGK